MEWWEVRAAIRGIRRRGRGTYDATRMLGWLVLSALGGKAESPAELVKFSWERDPKAEKEQAEKERALVEKMIEQARAENKKNGF